MDTDGSEVLTFLLDDYDILLSAVGFRIDCFFSFLIPMKDLISTPRLEELRAALDDAISRVDALSDDEHDYDYQLSVINRISTEAMSCSDVFELMRRMLKLREDYPTSLVWSMPLATLISDLRRCFVSFSSLESAELLRARSARASLIAKADEAVQMAQQAIDSYTGSQDYEIDVLKAKVDMFTSKKKA